MLIDLVAAINMLNPSANGLTALVLLTLITFAVLMILIVRKK